MTKKVFVKLTNFSDGTEMVLALDATYAVGFDPQGHTVVNGMIVEEKYDDILKKLEGYIDIV
jgi:hypothetical protein